MHQGFGCLGLHSTVADGGVTYGQWRDLRIAVIFAKSARRDAGYPACLAVGAATRLDAHALHTPRPRPLRARGVDGETASHS